jgi:hypothetical protein
LVAGNAAAEDPEEVIEEYGLSLTAGGGVAGFTDADMRDTADVGGLWDVRAAFGTKMPLAIEAGYQGSAQGIQAIGLDSDAVLLGTSLEALARVNVLPAATFTLRLPARPGAATTNVGPPRRQRLRRPTPDRWRRRHLPLSGLIADARVQRRRGDDLIQSDTSDKVDMHTWGATARSATSSGVRGSLAARGQTRLARAVPRQITRGRSADLIASVARQAVVVVIGSAWLPVYRRSWRHQQIDVVFDLPAVRWCTRGGGCSSPASSGPSSCGVTAAWSRSPTAPPSTCR